VTSDGAARSFAAHASHGAGPRIPHTGHSVGSSTRGKLPGGCDSYADQGLGQYRYWSGL
jgi:hypothetical protein